MGSQTPKGKGQIASYAWDDESRIGMVGEELGVEIALGSLMLHVEMEIGHFEPRSQRERKQRG